MSLLAQEDRIRAYASQRKYDLAHLYSDTGSASKPYGRSDFRAAIAQAAATGASILVASPDRLTRNLGDLVFIEKAGVQVISVEHGILSKRRLRELITRAAAESAEASMRQRAVNDRKRARGERLGNHKTLKEAGERGRLRNIERAEKNTLAILDHFTAHPESIGLSHRELAEALNAAGILNIKSERSEKLVSWTAGSIRKPRKRAMEEKAFREEMDAEDIAEALARLPGEGVNAPVTSPGRCYDQRA